MRSVRSIAIVFAIVVTTVAVCAAFILLTSWGASLVLGHVTARLLGPGNVVYERMEGSLLRGVHVFHMEVRHPRIFREGSVVRVQEFNMRLVRFSLDGLQAGIINARVIDPQGDPVVMNGDFHNGSYDLNAYSTSLDLRALRQVIKKFRDAPLLQGELKDIDLVWSGTLTRAALKGTFRVDHIPQNGFVLHEAPVRCDLSFVRIGGLWAPQGSLFIARGWLQAPHVLVRLRESRVIFTGDVRDPQLDIQGTARVGRIPIEITVKGTRKIPRVELSSDPSLPQAQLMLMLTTGKRWDSLSVANTGNKMTPELAGDFVDYFFFGGAGSKVAKSLGLSGISYSMDATKQGVTVNKDLSDRLGVAYGVAIGTTDPQGRREVTQTIDSEYRVTEHVTVSAQKEVLPAQRSSAVAPTRRIPDDRVYLKYRAQF